MKVTPVSGDMLLKIAMVLGAVGLVWYATNQAKKAVSGAIDAVSIASLNPFKEFDAWFERTILGRTTTTGLPDNFGVIDPNAPW